MGRRQALAGAASSARMGAAGFVDRSYPTAAVMPIDPRRTIFLRRGLAAPARTPCLQKGFRMTLQQQIDFFFAPPHPMQPGPSVSTLHLARREAQDCLIGTVVPEAEVLTRYPGLHRLF